MFKIIDYAGDAVKSGFVSFGSAWYWIYQNYTKEIINELEFKVIREEEERCAR